ncbi:hypothetical protein ABXS75_06375 [Roseburia hominis]
MNPMMLLQLKNLWSEFSTRHPKFPSFLKAVSQNGLQEGTILELQVTLPDGKTLASNLKITKEDVEMYRQIQEMRK